MDIFEKKFNKVEDEPSVSEDKLEHIRKNQEQIAEGLIELADEEIGRGNSAEVYIDPKDPDLCYKRITNGWNVHTPKKEAEFLESVRTIDSEIRVPHPVMTISFDYKKDGETLHCNALAMERINGKNLEEITTTGEFPEGAEPESKEDLKSFRDSFAKLRKLVQEMNSQLGIYHTDIKERNIMLDEDGQWWLIDFGEAKKEHFQQEVANVDKQDLDKVWSSFSSYALSHVEGLQNL